MPRHSAVDSLPEEVRRWLERALMDQRFSGYQQLESLLREQGYAIGKSSIHRYGRKIERRLAAIKASTEAARLLTEGAADDRDARSEAVIALVQTEMFESIVNLQEAEDETLPAAERIALLSKAAQNIATLARASVNQKKFRLEIEAQAREKLVEEQKAKLAELGRTGAVSPEALALVIRTAYDLS